MTTEIEVKKTEAEPAQPVSEPEPKPEKRPRRKYVRHKTEPTVDVKSEDSGQVIEPEPEIVVESAELQRDSDAEKVVPEFEDEKEPDTDSIANEAASTEEEKKDYGIYLLLFGIGMIALIYYLYRKYGNGSVSVQPEENVERTYQIVNTEG